MDLKKEEGQLVDDIMNFRTQIELLSLKEKDKQLFEIDPLKLSIG